MFIVYTLAVFLSSLVFDFVAARWAMAVTRRQTYQAVFFSGATALAGTIATIVCVERWSMIMPALCGHMLGTYVAMKRNKRK